MSALDTMTPDVLTMPFVTGERPTLRASCMPRANRPRGFTLVELLVVVAIVALLAALSIGALMTIPERARIRGTEATIAKIDAKLTQMLGEFNERRSTIRTIPADLTLSGNQPNLARVIAVTR